MTTAAELKATQAPLKERYRADPASAMVIMHAEAVLLPPAISCRVVKPSSADPGLHPAAGGDGSARCSGDMLLEALVACAGVTLLAVATSSGLSIRAGTVRAEGDLDFRGTMGVSRETPVGFQQIRLSFTLDTDATREQLDKLVVATERYCVVAQTIRAAVPVTVSV